MLARCRPVARRCYTRYPKNKQIYLHSKQGQYTANLLEDPNLTAIGYSESQEINPDTFVPNDKFVLLLNDVIRKTVHDDFTYIMDAGTHAQTFMPIWDFRDVPRYGRTPDVDSVYGYVLVDEHGKIVPETFEPNAMYRVCNGTGLMTLSQFLHDEVRKALNIPID